MFVIKLNITWVEQKKFFFTWFLYPKITVPFQESLLKLMILHLVWLDNRLTAQFSYQAHA